MDINDFFNYLEKNHFYLCWRSIPEQRMYELVAFEKEGDKEPVEKWYFTEEFLYELELRRTINDRK